MQRMIGASGVLLAVCIMGVSALINARYGTNLARAEFDKKIFIAIALFADVAKAISWIFLVASVVRRNLLAAAAAFLIFAPCFLWALAGSFGFMSMNRSLATQAVERDGQSVSDTRSAIVRKQAELVALGTGEPKAVLDKRLDIHRQDRLYGWTKKCADVTYEAWRAYCLVDLKLQAEIKKAEAKDKLENEITQLRKSGVHEVAVATVEGGDFQAALLAQVTTLSLSVVQMSLAVIAVFMIEFSACFLLWLSLNYMRQAQDDVDAGGALAVRGEDDGIALAPVDRVRLVGPQNAEAREQATATTNDFIQFVHDHLDVQDAKETALHLIIDDFKMRCFRQGVLPLSDALIEEGLSRFCAAGNIERIVRNEKVYLRGVVMAHKVDPAQSAMQSGATASG